MIECLDELVDAKIEHAQQFGAWHVRNGDQVPLDNWTSNAGLQYIQRVELALKAYNKMFDAHVKRLATRIAEDIMKRKRQ
jgi:hypothetical protein